MNHLSLLLAAQGWGELIVVLIFFMISALGQLLSAKNKPKRPRPPRPQKEGVPNKGQEVADKLRGEVEDFLREMQGKPPKKKSPKPKPVVLKVEQPVVAEKVTDMRQESVRDHVSKHLNTADIAQQVAKLGDDVEYADERLEQHLHERFDHKVGSLERRVQPVEEILKDSRAQDIAQMLRSPAGMRQAIIASEILRRPEI
ncbi:hypothetical protein [Bythopirellula goksoeyrii]|uniref:Uncharacterized protein n=1 Tax=Bythopirellula goksoeyrii TaxID=1400387 RepID=A0A5B9QUH4_9BACT|nr:hypothetical protein [Bythopirellula goksoeyrii]QEG37563.1 hypothetical protein Pr1d_49090 [Bythopirellula goksoeyrii]